MFFYLFAFLLFGGWSLVCLVVSGVLSKRKQGRAATVAFLLGGTPWVLGYLASGPLQNTVSSRLVDHHPFFRGKTQQYQISDDHQSREWCMDCEFNYEQFQLSEAGFADWLQDTMNTHVVQPGPPNPCHPSHLDWWTPLEQRDVRVYAVEYSLHHPTYLVYDPELQLAQTCLEWAS